MDLTNLTYTPAGGISATTAEGGAVYLSPGCDVFNRAVAGEWGAVAPFDVAAAEAGALEAERSRALLKIDQHHAQMLTEATGSATSAERDTWTVKAAAASAYLADTASLTQAAMSEAEGGDDPDALAQRIIQKSDAYQMLVGIAGGIRATARAAVRGASTLNEIDAALSAAKDAAHTALALAMEP
jgi:hypothetical protein